MDCKAAGTEHTVQWIGTQNAKYATAIVQSLSRNIKVFEEKIVMKAMHLALCDTDAGKRYHDEYLRLLHYKCLRRKQKRLGDEENLLSRSSDANGNPETVAEDVVAQQRNDMKIHKKPNRKSRDVACDWSLFTE